MSYENCYFICDLKKYTNKKKDMFETAYYLRNIVAMFSSLWRANHGHKPSSGAHYHYILKSGTLIS